MKDKLRLAAILTLFAIAGTLDCPAALPVVDPPVSPGSPAELVPVTGPVLLVNSSRGLSPVQLAELKRLIRASIAAQDKYIALFPANAAEYEARKDALIGFLLVIEAIERRG